MRRLFRKVLGCGLRKCGAWLSSRFDDEMVALISQLKDNRQLLMLHNDGLRLRFAVDGCDADSICEHVVVALE